jgi:hypothetical protein
VRINPKGREGAITMADTRSGISWSLERSCPLRNGDGWPLPTATHQQLAEISAFSNAVPDGLVVDDICVTSYTFGSDDDDESVILPYSGFRISLALAPFGGEAAVRAACGACEANVSRRDGSALAGCHGFFGAWADNEELESELREKVRLKGLEAELVRLFPSTTPLWYGFWIESPFAEPSVKFCWPSWKGSTIPMRKETMT